MASNVRERLDRAQLALDAHRFGEVISECSPLLEELLRECYLRMLDRLEPADRDAHLARLAPEVGVRRAQRSGRW